MGDKLTGSNGDTVLITTTFCSLPTYAMFISTHAGAVRALTPTELNAVWNATPFPHGVQDHAC